MRRLDGQRTLSIALVWIAATAMVASLAMTKSLAGVHMVFAIAFIATSAAYATGQIANPDLSPDDLDLKDDP